MATKKTPLRYTVEEYLAIERHSQERFEYLDGNIFAMAGESQAHADISMNLAINIGSQLRGTHCRAWAKDTKVRSGPTPRRGTMAGLYSYPDLVVICGEPQYHDEYEDVVLNPIVIIEVLSESTESFDRGEKSERYRTWNRTLTDYLLVSQTQPLIERYVRQADGGWASYIYSGLDQKFPLKSINCELRLSDVYERIVFRAEETGNEEM